MKAGYIVCDECRKNLVHPALIDVTMKVRVNVGLQRNYENPANPGITKGIMGFVEVDIEGDFCDGECLRFYARKKASEKDPSAATVRQDIFFRNDAFTPGGPK